MSEEEQGGDDVPKEGEADKENDKETGKEEGGDSPSPPTAIEVAEKLHSQIKEQNDRHEKLLQRQEKLHAERMLGGHSNAGKEPEKPKELSPKEYADKVMAGEKPE